MLFFAKNTIVNGGTLRNEKNILKLTETCNIPTMKYRQYRQHGI